MKTSLLWLLLLLSSSHSCPTNETLRQLCKCESTANGILLDCSSSSPDDSADTVSILRVLQENSAQLGLIQELLLRNGSLRQLPAEDGSANFNGLYIKKLDLSNNALENISSDAFRGLENVLQILILSNNRLRRFPASALSKMGALLQLDLSDNDIGDFEESDILRNTPKLFDLNLANNRICNLHKQAFDEVKQSLQTLNLGGNCFDKVPAAAVRGFKRLLALHLHNNRIQQLEPLQFMNLPALNLINLARNRIEAVHRQSFLNVPNLRFMYLSDNNITQLEANDFRTFDNLELLDLTRNRIDTIPSSAFVGMPRLSQLYLGENGIQTIQANAFSNSTLVILLLPNNELTELRADMFNGLTYLQQFSLKGNKITQIAANAFYQMPSLVVIDLSDNQLASLEPATFLAQLNLFLLDLSRNKLAATPYNAFNQRTVTVVLQGFKTVSSIPTGPTSPVPASVNPTSFIDVPAFVQETQSPQPVGFEKPTSSNSSAAGARPLTVVHRPHDGPIVAPGSGASVQSNIPANPPPHSAAIQPNPTSGIFSSATNSKNDAVLPSLSAFHAGEGQPVAASNGRGGPVTGGQGPPLVDDGQTGPNGDAVGDGPAVSVVENLPPKPLPGAQTDRPSHLSSPPSQQQLPNFGAPIPGPSSPGSQNPGFVEQVPLDENQETRGGPVQPDHHVGNGESPQSDSSQGTETPEFSWTWPVAQGQPAPAAPSLPSLSPRSFPPLINDLADPATPAALPVDVITASIPVWTSASPKPMASSRRPGKPRQEDTGDFTLSPEPRTVPTKKHKLDDELGGSDAAAAAAGEFDPATSSAGANATTTIAVCLTVVVVVMVAVFVTLCIVRRRNSQTANSISSASRVSEYAAAQARLNYATSTYGVAGPCGVVGAYGASASGNNARATLQRPSSAANQAWIYAPGTYASPSAYYK